LFLFFFQAAFEDEEGSQYFDSEDVFQQLNYECNDFGDDSGSDRDDDVVGLSLNCLCSRVTATQLLLLAIDVIDLCIIIVLINNYTFVGIILNCSTYLQCDYSNQGHPTKFSTNLTNKTCRGQQWLSNKLSNKSRCTSQKQQICGHFG